MLENLKFRALMALVLLLTVHCTRPAAELDGARCPCIDGFVCCPATERCMPADLLECPIELISVEPTEGPVTGGIQLTVTGQALPSSTEILLDGTSCLTLEPASKQQALCTLPARALPGPVVVSVRTAAGRTGQLEAPFVYRAAPPIEVDPCDPPGADCPITMLEASPPTGPLEGDTRVTLRGAHFPSDLQVKFGGRWCTDLQVLSPQEAVCRTPPAAESERLVALSAIGGENRRGGLADGFRYLLPSFTDKTPALGDAVDEVVAFGVGLTLSDVDHDGLIDLYFSRSSDVFPSGRTLFSTVTPFVYEDRTAALGFGAIPNHHALIPGDFDGDGIGDWLVGFRSTAVQAVGSHFGLLRGRPGGRVSRLEPILDMVVDPQLKQQLLAAPVDLDGDGDLDLIGCRKIGTPDDRQRLLMQLENVDGALHEIVPQIAEDSEAATTECNTIAVADFDGDGDVDLAVCGVSLRLYRKDAGGWTDVTQPLGLTAFFDTDGLLDQRCVSLDWVDVDADGALDLAWSHAGAGGDGAGLIVARWSGEGFSPLAAAHELPPQDADCGDELPLRTTKAGDYLAFWLDVDNDGDQDLLSPSPFVYSRCRRSPYLLRSHFAQGEARYTTEVVPLEPAYGVVQVNNSTGGVSADLDSDGDLDLVTHSWGGGRRIVLRNNSVENGGRPAVWIAPITDPDGDATDADLSDDRLAPHVRVELDLDGPEGAPDFRAGVGALAVAGDARGTSSYGPYEVHFGIGDRELPMWVRVRFPDGSVTTTKVDSVGVRIEVRDCAQDRCGAVR